MKPAGDRPLDCLPILVDARTATQLCDYGLRLRPVVFDRTATPSTELPTEQHAGRAC